MKRLVLTYCIQAKVRSSLKVVKSTQRRKKMKIKVVTDSSADLSQDIVRELGITTVPLYVRFGDEIFRERVTITDEEFYKRLTEGPVHPSTIQPGPNDFIEVYQKLSREAEGILSIHISSKLSGTHNSAIQAKNMMTSSVPIEIVDSQSVSAALGLIVIAAAKLAGQQKDLKEVVKETNEMIGKTHLLGLLDTLKYVEKGGRIGKARALLGTMLNIKPLLTLKDGEVVPAGQVRTRKKGMEQLLSMVETAKQIDDVAVAYNTTREDAESLSKQIASLAAKPKVRVFKLGTTLGVHTGPGTLIVALRGTLPK
jgi:DegV family protein with EDD domain